MNKYKIVFIDIDGTLYNSESKVTEKTKEVINKVVDMGVLVVLTSGRCSYNVREIAKLVGTSPYIICSNGAEVYDLENNKPVFKSVLDKRIINEVYDYCEKSDLRIFLNGEFIRYSNAYSNHYINKIEDNNIIDEDFTQVVIEGINYNRMLALKGLIQDKYKTIVNVNSSQALKNNTPHKGDYYYRDFINEGVSKSCGITELLDYLNISPSEAISIGDGTNDISMFMTTDLSIAMGNSSDMVAMQANQVTLSNDADGVAIALSEIFNI